MLCDSSASVSASSALRDICEITFVRTHAGRAREAHNNIVHLELSDNLFAFFCVAAVVLKLYCMRMQSACVCERCYKSARDVDGGGGGRWTATSKTSKRTGTRVHMFTYKKSLSRNRTLDQAQIQRRSLQLAPALGAFRSEVFSAFTDASIASITHTAQTKKNRTPNVH